ncbi:MAG: hypothetical protein M3R25_12385 [Bacteroidota bacterium]|nr:hypothetical protein [Bacteroidota bacterium]
MRRSNYLESETEGIVQGPTASQAMPEPVVVPDEPLLPEPDHHNYPTAGVGFPQPKYTWGRSGIRKPFPQSAFVP